MKYNIESTENGCIETLEFSNSEKYTKRTERTDSGCKSLDPEFTAQLKAAGFCEEVIEGVEETFENFIDLNFLNLAALDN